MQYFTLALIFCVAALFSIIAHRLKQPLIMGYIFSGFLIGVFGFFQDDNFITGLGKIGVTLLLFLVGMEMDPKEIKSVGKVALLTGILQILFTFSIALGIGLLLSFGLLTSVYLAIAVSFSSTIIIVKLLTEKHALGSLYGKIAVGFLLVQDFVAIVILLILSGVSQGNLSLVSFAIMVIKAGGLLVSTYLISKKVIPLVMQKLIGDSPELLMVVSIAWALGFSSIVAGPLGFSLEIGGFLAGLALSAMPEHFEIAARTRPLRDFFLTLFFLGLGMSLKLGSLDVVLIPAIIFSLLVIIGNPLIVMSVMGILKFKKRVSFLASVTVAQISEFSLVIVAMGITLGHLTNNTLTLVILIAAITMTVSTYLINASEKVYSKIKDYLGVFERKDAITFSLDSSPELVDHIVLVGCYRTGGEILPYIKKSNHQYLVIDYSPSVYEKMKNDDNSIMFGDISDPEILVEANLQKAKLIISTVDNVHANLTLLEYLKRFPKRPQTIITSVTRSHAVKLYESGANYVLVPNIITGDHIKHLIKTYGFGGNNFVKMGKSHYKKIVGLVG